MTPELQGLGENLQRRVWGSVEDQLIIWRGALSHNISVLLTVYFLCVQGEGQLGH